MPKSLRARLTLILVVVAVVPLLFLAGLIAWRSFAAMQDQAIALQQAITRQLAAEVGTFLNQRQNELEMLVELRGLGKLDQPAQRDILASLLAKQPAYQQLTLLDQDGQERIRLSRSGVVTEKDLTSQADSEVFLQPINSGEIYYSPVWFDETIREPLMTLAIPLIDLQSGQATAVLLAELRFNLVGDLVANFSGGKYAYVVDRQGMVVAHSDPSLVLGQTTFKPPVTDGAGRFSGLSGSDVILAATPVQFDNQELIAVAEQPYNEATALATSLLIMVVFITVVALVTAVVAGLMMMRQIIDPLEKLSVGVRAVQAGDFSQTVEVTGQDEIGQLAQAFNSMTIQLRQRLKELRRLAAVLENTSDLVSMADMQGKILYINNAGLKMMGRSGQDITNLSISDLHPPEETQRTLTEHLPILMEQGNHTWESQVQHTDGYSVPVSQVSTVIYDEIGQPEAMATIMRDLSLQKQAEAERARLQQEIIEAQNQVIRELSSPVIPLMDRIIVMPLIGSIDTMRARDITRTLLTGISQHHAKVVILDVTGVPLVDSGVANHLNKTIQAARLKGAHTIVTGISDAVAETIVDLGISWKGVQTLRDLQTGLVAALNSLGIKLTSS